MGDSRNRATVTGCAAGLAVQSVEVSIGGLRVLRRVSLEVRAGEVVGLVGPNGAGKSTLVNVIAGAVRPGAGSVLLDGAPLDGMSTARRARMGIARTFQNLEVPGSLTLAENMQIALEARRAVPRRYRRARIAATLEQVGLASLADRPVAELPYGQKKLVELARVLVCDPSIALLDEPAAGLSTTEKEEMDSWIALLRQSHDVAILLIEHDMSVIRALCNRVVILEQGSVLAAGAVEDALARPEVVESYLGSRRQPRA